MWKFLYSIKQSFQLEVKIMEQYEYFTAKPNRKKLSQYNSQIFNIINLDKYYAKEK